MSYCTFSDVQEDFKSVVQFSNTSLVTSSAVTKMIAEADALINSYIGAVYILPLTQSTSTDLMRLYSRTVVSDRVRGILENKQTTNIDGNQNVKAVSFSTKDVMAGLRDLKDKVFPLVGETLAYPGAGFFSNNNERNEQPRFRKDSRQW